MHPSGEFALVTQEPGSYILSSWQNVVISSWRSHGTASSVSKIYGLTERLLETYPAGVSGIHIIHNGAGAPTPDGRLEMRRIMDVLGPRLGCVAVALEGRGFWASTIRSVFVGMNMLAPRSYALRIFAAAQDVVQWFPVEHERRTGVAIVARELADHLMRIATVDAAH